MTETDTRVLDWPLPRTSIDSPPAALAELRQGPPCKVRLRDDQYAWLITRHADVKQALNDSRLSVDDQNPGFPNRLLLKLEPRIQSFWRMDPPEHSRLRKMVMVEFTAHRVAAMRPQIQQTVDALLDEVERLPRPFDLYQSFALPLPCAVIGRIFGVPGEDMADFQRHSNALLNQEAPEEAFASYIATTQYLDRLCGERDLAPQDDLISRLVTDYMRPGLLSREDLVAMVRLMLVAGHETTANQIALSLLTLLRRPELAASLREDPSTVRPLVEELLRFWSIPQDNVVRVAATDLEIGGVPIPAGDGVIISIPAANHDEAVFPRAAEFDPSRDTRAHLAFGHGVHHCPGGPLAALELELALLRVAERFPDMRLAVPAEEVPFRTSSLVYGLHELPVTW
ncbi:cytochrome P450 [Microbispora sp. NPDC049125]|uniref:cytochrome P450 n=1 Tax=Microbispora sp. NPDC049125 TaxID=3154929 RepID=UPI003465F0D8